MRACLRGFECSVSAIRAHGDFFWQRDLRVLRGFAVGRTIFAESAKAWLAGRMSDEEAVDQMAQKFGALVAVWEGLGGANTA